MSFVLIAQHRSTGSFGFANGQPTNPNVDYGRASAFAQPMVVRLGLEAKW
jgi:hypothetical protein